MENNRRRCWRLLARSRPMQCLPNILQAFKMGSSICWPLLGTWALAGSRQRPLGEPAPSQSSNGRTELRRQWHFVHFWFGEFVTDHRITLRCTACIQLKNSVSLHILGVIASWILPALVRGPNLPCCPDGDQSRSVVRSSTRDQSMTVPRRQARTPVNFIPGEAISTPRARMSDICS